MAEFHLDLGLSLKRCAEVLVSQTLWKSQDVTRKIDELIRENKLKIPESGYRFLGLNPLARYLSDDSYYYWEEVIDYVFKKIDSLSLPSGVTADLREIIILMGEKMIYFYDKYKEPDQPEAVFWEHIRCSKCTDAAETEHFYSFSNNGILLYTCSALHFKNVPEKESQEFKEFLDDACRQSNLEIIKKYQNDIIVYLESLQPGLNIKNKRDIIFNIICVWNFIQYKETWKKMTYHDNRELIDNYYNDNGYIKLPSHYLENIDFIIPLEIVPQMMISSCPPTLKYLASKLREYDDQLLFLKMKNIQINYEQGIIVNKRLHFYLNPDYNPNRILITLKLMSEREKSDFIQANLKNILVYFLPVWPFREIVPHILDVCIAKNFNLDSLFFLDLLSVCIGNQNRNRHKVQKQTYIEEFLKIWNKTSFVTKLRFLAGKTMCLLFQNEDCHLVKNVLFNGECPQDAESVINKWEEILEKPDFALVNKFLKEAIFNGELLVNELELFLSDCNEAVYWSVQSCAYDFFI